MLDAYASLPHFQRHLKPVVAQLDGVRCWSRGGECDWPVMRPNDREATDLVLVASWDDAQRFADKRVVYVEHGAGQTYVGGRGTGYAGAPGLDHVVLFVCPNVDVAARWQRTYPAARVVVAGAPALDLHFGRQFRDGESALRAHSDTSQTHVATAEGREEHAAPGPPFDGRSVSLPVRRPAVVFTFHWRCRICPETMPALPHFSPLDPVFQRLRDAGLEPVGSSHPRARGAAARLWGELGVRHEPDPDSILTEAGVVVADNTSLMYEAAAVGIPVVALNAPWYRRDVHHGLRFWDYVPGLQCDQPDQLADTIVAAHAGAGEEERVRAASRAYDLADGCAAARAAEAIADVDRSVGALAMAVPRTEVAGRRRD